MGEKIKKKIIIPFLPLLWLTVRWQPLLELHINFFWGLER